MAVTNEMRTQVLELYTAYFNRAADKAGVDYWLNEMDVNGWDILTVASSFTDSPEYVNLYGSKSNAQIIEAVYQNVLGRSGDSAGVTYWLDELNSGTIAVQNFITAVVNAATEEINGAAKWPQDKAMVDNKSAVSQYCYDLNINNTDISLSSVTGDSSSVNGVIAYMDEIVPKVFSFTQEWLAGKTIYDVFAGDDDGIFDEMEAFAFNSDGTGTITYGDESMDFNWSVDSEGILTLSNNYATYYVNVLEESDYNALKIVWAETYYEALNAQADSSNYRYIFLNYDDATDFITDQDNSYQEFLPADMEALASLVGLNTYTGELSNASIREQVIALTGSDAYYEAFDPSNYEGSSDGVFTTEELGLSHLSNLPATTETLESLFYGTIINTFKAIDMDEAMSIETFIDSHEAELEAGDEETLNAYIELIIDTFIDQASQPILDDATIAEIAVMTGEMFVELVGIDDNLALFDGILLGL